MRGKWRVLQQGLIVFLAIAYLFSTDRRAVKLRPIAAGLVLQAVLAFFFLRSSAGRWTFKLLADQIVALLNRVDAGSSFVFGPDYDKYHFAMKVSALLPRGRTTKCHAER